MGDGAGDEHAAFEREFRAAINAPGDGGEQVVFGRHRLGAGVHEHKATGTVSVLHHAGAGAALAEKGGLLIASNAGNWNLAPKQFGFAHHFTGAPHLGQYTARDLEQLEQFRIPIALF